MQDYTCFGCFIPRNDLYTFDVSDDDILVPTPTLIPSPKVLHLQRSVEDNMIQDYNPEPNDFIVIDVEKLQETLN